jgi:nucleotide-binding universal stress UspA family protein
MIRIRKILCPIDFFPASKGAADYAVALAKNYGARLIFLHVVEPFASVTGYEVPINLEELTESMVDSATEEMLKIAKRAETKGIRVEPVIRTGNVDLEIAAAIKDRKADLVVMGTHGRRGFERWFAGSVTERLLRRTRVPLLTMGNTKEKAGPAAIRRILVTTDFSAGTSDAFAYAFSVAKECHAEVTVLHVLDDISADIAGRYREGLIESIREKLEKLVPAGARNGCKVTVRVETGRPGKRILGILEAGKYDLLVLNIHGKGMFDRVTIGSTAERIVRSVPIPVLFIPPKAEAKRLKKQVRKAA